LTDFEAKKKRANPLMKKGISPEAADVSALEHNELDFPMIREFTIHIL
jgi:hypothetical protein